MDDKQKFRNVLTLRGRPFKRETKSDKNQCKILPH